MILQKFAVICRIDHIAGGDDHIGIMLLFDIFHVFHVSGDIIIINGKAGSQFCVKDLETSSFGVDVVMTSGSEMFYERAGFASDIALDMVNSAVVLVVYRKIDDTVSVDERKCSDGSVVLHHFHPDISS